ncbi:hypothetical protein HMPREF3069_04985 [Achromobacter xylosoxidans]|uniref:hypothetical protein n=1 Tax=Alcaligenes xylosoxydans xylosoxydans TaxID=85698 RepID=UPI0008A50B4C|nr:hypothetical protein [Achromobacter xylosoxidans]OFS61649.1 hypothetical protein HMPREF3069_04985 [Achromobacter xylosoxidans]
MTNEHNPDFQKLPTGWRSLWRAHTQLARELASEDFTIYVRAINHDAADLAVRRALLAMYEGRAALDLDEAYYNLTSATMLIEQGVSDHHVDRLFEAGWHDRQVVAWVRNPVFVVPDAGQLHHAWKTARCRAFFAPGKPMSAGALHHLLQTMPAHVDVAVSYPDLQNPGLQYETRDVRFGGLRTDGSRECVFLDAFGGV